MFQKTRLSKTVRDHKEEYHYLRRNCFVSPYRKYSWRKSSVFQNFWVSKKLMHKSGGDVTIFCQNFVVSMHRNFVENPSDIQKVCGIQNFIDK